MFLSWCGLFSGHYQFWDRGSQFFHGGCDGADESRIFRSTVHRSNTGLIYLNVHSCILHFGTSIVQAHLRPSTFFAA
jgi:hypothetical protein